MNWSVYIILCTDDTFYTGITIDITKRYQQHASGQGAKYFRGRQPKQLVYLEPGHNRSTATKREMNLKKLNRNDKSRLIASDSNKLSTLQTINQNNSVF
jgi:putative endonuclease